MIRPLSNDGPGAALKSCLSRLVGSAPQPGLTLIVTDKVHSALPGRPRRDGHASLMRYAMISVAGLHP